MLAIQLMMLLLPWRLRRVLLARLFGYVIHPTARIGRSLLRVRYLEMGRNSSIGSLTYAKGLDRLILEEEARLGPLNWVTAYPKNKHEFFSHRPDRDPSLVIARHAAVTGRHLLDCTGGVFIGAFTTIGGWGSQIVSHSIDIKTSRQDAEPVTVGDYCFVGTRVILLKGAGLPSFSVLAAGSVLGKAFSEPAGLFSGVPASRVRDLDLDNLYFSRLEGYVH